jgi:rod shape-determining protein MreD
MVDQPTLGLTLLQLIATILAYPLVVAVTVFAFGLRRAAPGEVDDRGHRL